ncbi:MAG: RHS repeat-associated core domain-containing protein, partial [Eubacterium sp.]|nr:RHS repeat-associated core domain-containing protein [Eubacterium sp.]
MSQKAGNDFIYFRYDTNGTPIGFVYNDTQYLYMTNQLGDVIGITDAQGKELVEYEYDEWGSMLDITLKSDDETVSTLAELNPLRYRGYYYDNETGMYYLQSRYYNPEWGRFISADDFSNIDTSKKYFNMNAYIYCWNCPISFKDDKGTAPTISIDIEAFISFVKTTNDKITDKLTTRFQENLQKLQNRFDTAVEKARFYFYNPDVLLSRILSTITGLDIKIEFKVLKWLKEH